MNKFTAGTLSLLIARSGTKLEKTSLSTGGSEVPAHDISYIIQLLIYCTAFRTVFVRIHYAVLIATPEPL